MQTVCEKMPAGSSLENQAAELADQLRQAIKSGEIFKNVKRIYRKLKKVQKKIALLPAIHQDSVATI